MTNLSSSQEEADTLLIVQGLHASKEGENEDLNIIVRSPDTDVFLLLVAFSPKFNHPLYFDIGSANKRRIIHINTLWELHKDIQDGLPKKERKNHSPFFQNARSSCQPSKSWDKKK